MIQLNHKDMIETVEDYTKYFTIIKGLTDIIQYEYDVPDVLGTSGQIKTIVTDQYTLKDNHYWVILGKLPDETINDIINDDNFKKTDGIHREGYYQYTACIYYKQHTYEEPTEGYIDYIEFQFIESFQERNREFKLNQLLIDDTATQSVKDTRNFFLDILTERVTLLRELHYYKI